jgi:O-antigen ligase
LTGSVTRSRTSAGERSPSDAHITGASSNGSGSRTLLLIAGVVAAAGAATTAGVLAGSDVSKLLFAAALAVALGLCALTSPVFATILLLLAMYLRFPIRSEVALPAELFFFVFAALVVSAALWIDRTPNRLRGFGAVEWAMAAYLMWNVYSMFSPHKYAPGAPLDTEPYSVSRFIVIATVIPFAVYLVGRYMFDRRGAVHALLWAVVAMAAYTGAISIMPFIGLVRWVWPYYAITDDTSGWTGRALGVFDNPVANGMVLVIGFGIAMFLMSFRSETFLQRSLAVVAAVLCGGGIYFTYTRAVWLSAVAVLIVGALLAKGFRRGFVTVLALVIAMVAVNWSTFTSADRHAGGVASLGEVQARLNVNQTALWAFAQKPLEGWGIARFRAINLYHHQYLQGVPWVEGYGESSHENELGILAELGVIGLLAWICVLAFIAYRLWKAYRELPGRDLCGKPLVVIAIMAMVVFVCTGLTVDLRYFDFPAAVTFLLIGIAIGWSDRAELSREVPQ